MAFSISIYLDYNTRKNACLQKHFFEVFQLHYTNRQVCVAMLCIDTGTQVPIMYIIHG